MKKRLVVLLALLSINCVNNARPHFFVEKRFCELTTDEKTFVEDLISERGNGIKIGVARAPLDAWLHPCYVERDGVCKKRFLWKGGGRIINKKIFCTVYPSSLIFIDEDLGGVKIKGEIIVGNPDFSCLIPADFVDIPLCRALELRKMLDSTSECTSKAKELLDDCLIRHKACLTHEIGHCLDMDKHPYRYNGLSLKSSAVVKIAAIYGVYAWFRGKMNFSFLKTLFRSTGIGVVICTAINKAIAKYLNNAAEYAADDYVTDEGEMRVLKNTLLVYEERRRLCLSETLQNILNHMPGGWFLYDTWLDFEHPTCEQRIARIDRRLQEMGAAEG